MIITVLKAYFQGGFYFLSEYNRKLHYEYY
jgi:hypothetical protein